MDAGAKKWGAGILIGLLLFFFFWISYVLWSTNNFQKCLIQNEHSSYTTQATKDNSPKIIFSIVVAARNDTICAADTAYEYRDAISVIATVLIAFFTFTLWHSTYRLWGATDRSIRLAQQEFNATHRPKIRLKHIWPVQPFEADKPFIVDVVYVNIGDGVALIQRYGVGFYVIDEKGQLPENLTVPGVEMQVECGLGMTHEIKNVSSAETQDRGAIGLIQRDKAHLFCFGFIEYSETGSDETRRIRKTAFCRRFVWSNFSHGIGRFVKLEKPDTDYEYED